MNPMPVISKSALMTAVAAGVMREYLTHSTEGVFDVTAMREYAEQSSEICLVETREMYRMVMGSRVTSATRSAELSRDQWARDPIIAVVYDDGTHLLIDGSHRTMRAYMEGLPHMYAYILPESAVIRPGEGERQEINWGEHDIVDGEIKKRDV